MMPNRRTNPPRSAVKSTRSSTRSSSPRRCNTSSIHVGFWIALIMICLLFNTVESFSPQCSTVRCAVVETGVRKQRQGRARRHLIETASPLTPPTPPTTTSIFAASSSTADRAEGEAASNNDEDPNEIIARRIIVEGSVQGGYYRSCVLNEGGRFRNLTGTMTPPDDSDRAEIYVEGSRKQVNGFIRWCRKGNVGLSQITTVAEVLDAEPTGLYDGFYVKTK